MVLMFVRKIVDVCRRHTFFPQSTKHLFCICFMFRINRFIAVHTLTMVRNQKIGFIFQNYQLIPTYNVMQNIIMPLLMRGMTHEEAEEKCKNTIKLLGLDHRIGHRPNELSGGQKQRVSIARALVGQPAILLADEPTGALDQTSGKEVLKLFRELNDMGNTIVMITHSRSIAQTADRVLQVSDGVLTDFGRCAE